MLYICCINDCEALSGPEKATTESGLATEAKDAKKTESAPTAPYKFHFQPSPPPPPPRPPSSSFASPVQRLANNPGSSLPSTAELLSSSFDVPRGHKVVSLVRPLATAAISISPFHTLLTRHVPQSDSQQRPVPGPRPRPSPHGRRHRNTVRSSLSRAVAGPHIPRRRPFSLPARIP